MIGTTSVAVGPSRLTARRRAWSHLGLDARKELPRHHDALHLVGALVDLRDLGVAHHPLHRVVLGEAVAAEYLDGVHRDLHGGVGGEALRGRAEEREVPIVAL